MQTLESLAYTLNHIYLEDRKVKTYEIPESGNNLIAAEPRTFIRKSKTSIEFTRLFRTSFHLSASHFNHILMLLLYRPIHGIMCE